MSAHEPVPFVVTTSRKPDGELERDAGGWAERLQAPYAQRGNYSLASLMARAGVPAVLVVSRERPVFVWPERDVEYFFHPSMAKIRLQNLAAGRGDPMVTAMGLQEGLHVLDCTLGRASDAIVASHVVGPKGRVVGLEVVPMICYLTADGIQHHRSGRADLDAALRRIGVECADYRERLPKCESRSFDIVYFDPVFTRPLLDALPMAPLRELAAKGTVTPEVLQEARRVARKRVVIKDVVHSELWTDLGIEAVVRGSGSRTEYGVIEGEA